MPASDMKGADAKAETKEGALRGGVGKAALIGVGILATTLTAALAALPMLAGGTARTLGGGAAPRYGTIGW